MSVRARLSRLLRPAEYVGNTAIPSSLDAPPGCVHEYYYSWAGRCESCRLTPISGRIKQLEEKFDREG